MSIRETVDRTREYIPTPSTTLTVNKALAALTTVTSSRTGEAVTFGRPGLVTLLNVDMHPEDFFELFIVIGRRGLAAVETNRLAAEAKRLPHIGDDGQDAA